MFKEFGCGREVVIFYEDERGLVTEKIFTVKQKIDAVIYVYEELPECSKKKNTA